MSWIGISHDAFFKRLLSEPGAASTLIGERLPAEVAALLAPEPPELVPGSFVDETLATHHSDLLYRVRTRDGRPALIYVLIEHKSQADRGTPVQLLRYMVRIWARWVAEAGPERLPAIVPLVFYHGAAEWAVPRDFAELFETEPALTPYLPRFRYELVDLGRIGDDELSKLAVLRSGLLALKYVFHEELAQHLQHILGPLRGGDLDFVISVLRYILRGPGRLQTAELRAAIGAALPEQEGSIMSTLTDEWLEQGRVEGETRGLVRGRAEGRAEMLVRLLERRFGPLPAESRRQIEAADPAMLELWFDRALDGLALDAIFRS